MIGLVWAKAGTANARAANTERERGIGTHPVEGRTRKYIPGWRNRQMKQLLRSHFVLLLAATQVAAQQTTSRPMRPEDTEVWQPVPKIVASGKTDRDAPADAIVLFGGGNL